MKRLTDAQRDEATRWFALVAARARGTARRHPHLAEDAADCVSLAVMGLATAAYRSPTLAGLKFRSALSHAIRASDTYRRHRDAAEPIAPDAHDKGPTPALDALLALPPRQREAIELRILDRADLSTVAAIMNTSKGNAHKYLTVGLTKLRTLLQESA